MKKKLLKKKIYKYSKNEKKLLNMNSTLYFSKKNTNTYAMLTITSVTI